MINKINHKSQIIIFVFGILIGATAYGAVVTTQTTRTVINVPFYGNSKDYPNLSERAILNRWLNDFVFSGIETQYEITPGTLSACTTKARINIVYTPLEEDPTWCDISVSAEVILPGNFSTGTVSGGQ